MSLLIKSFLKLPLKNNNYVVADEASREAVLIDCSSPDDEIMNWLQAQGLTLKYILLTHGHFDHLLGVNYYRQKWGLRAYLYAKDKELLSRVNDYPHMLGWPAVDVPQVEIFTLDHRFFVGSYPVEIIATPGHTIGSVCYFVDGKLFSGDTLFHGTTGRTDLPESDEGAMSQSLALLFQKFPDETPVYSGHGASTTIGHERRWQCKD